MYKRKDKDNSFDTANTIIPVLRFITIKMNYFTQKPKIGFSN